MNVVLSYGQGVDSTALLLRWLAEPDSRDFDLSQLMVVRAMTGEEWPRTGELVDDHILPRLRSACVFFAQVARRGASELPAREHILVTGRTGAEFKALPQLDSLAEGCSRRASGLDWPVSRSWAGPLADLPRAASPPSSGLLSGAMTYSQKSHRKPPTQAQLELIEKLCEERGARFHARPASARQADERIKALLAMPRFRGERIEDEEAVESGFAAWGGATAIRDDEVVGYGSTARWA